MVEAMFKSELLAKLYMEPRPLTEEWLHRLLFRLWERGLHYNDNYAAEPLTWQEELDVLADGFVEGCKINKDVQLRMLIKQAVAADGGLIMMYDKGVLYHLSIDLSGAPDGDAARFGEVVLMLDGPYISDNQLAHMRDVEEGVLTRYERVMRAFAGWMEVLCEVCGPVFAVGYDSNREREVDDYVRIEAPLFAGCLPDHAVWYPLTYISPRFIDADLLCLLLQVASPGGYMRWVKCGGVFVYRPYEFEGK